jgi:hypothetical protein
MEQRRNNSPADSGQANQFADLHAHLARTLLARWLEGQELIVTHALGERGIQTGTSMLSTTIESECASISFVRDYCVPRLTGGFLLRRPVAPDASVLQMTPIT